MVCSIKKQTEPLRILLNGNGTGGGGALLRIKRSHRLVK